jgi:FkbM family methyltransferase
VTTVAKLLAFAKGEVRTVIDVGAFVGGFSQNAAFERPEVLFLAVEPVPVLAAELRRQTASLPNYWVVEAAIGSRERESELLVPSSGAYNFSSLSPMLDSRRDWRDVILDQRISVQVLPLSQVVEEFVRDGDFVAKIDVQGRDLEVLESLGSTLGRLRAGVLETAVRRRDLLYVGSPTRADTARALWRHGFEVVRVEAEHPANHDQNLVFARRNLITFWPLWRAAYPLLVGVAWLRYLPIRVRVRAALRTRVRRLLRN